MLKLIKLLFLISMIKFSRYIYIYIYQSKRNLSKKIVVMILNKIVESKIMYKLTRKIFSYCLDYELNF